LFLIFHPFFIFLKNNSIYISILSPKIKIQYATFIIKYIVLIILLYNIVKVGLINYKYENLG